MKMFQSFMKTLLFADKDGDIKKLIFFKICGNLFILFLLSIILGKSFLFSLPNVTIWVKNKYELVLNL